MIGWPGLDRREAPEAPRRVPVVTRNLAGRAGPVIAATDYIRAHADQIRAHVPARYRVLGTDGFGRSDTREKLREFFEVDRHYIVLAALGSGGETAFGDTYFMTQPRFETGDERYDWLNRVVAVAEGRVLPNAVEYRVYQDLNG